MSTDPLSEKLLYKLQYISFLGGGGEPDQRCLLTHKLTLTN